MKHNQFKRFLATMLTLVMTSMLITPALAATNYETIDEKPVIKKNSSDVKTAVLASIKAQDGQTQFSPEELEQMRTALFELLDSNQELSALLSPQGKQRVRNDFGPEKAEDQFAEVRNQIQQMSAEQLTTLRKVLSPSKMRAKLAASRATLDEYKNSLMKASSNAPNSAGLPGINAYCAPLSPAAIVAADVIYFAAESVRDIAQNVCNQVVLGANLRSGCNVTDAIYLAAKGVNQGIHFCDDDYAQSVGQASFDRLEHIHNDLEGSIANDNANKTEIVNNDNANKTTIVNNDNANKTEIVNNDNANKDTIVTTVENAKTTIIVNANANKDELIRLHIGADLASTDSSVLVAAFMLPAAKGGYLELTRSVVFDALTKLAGNSTAQANAILAQGDAARNSGDYKGAYTAYRKAYKTATK